MSSIKIDADLIPRSTQTRPSFPQERRKETRYVPIKDRAYLGWWVGDDFHTAAGSLRDVSSGGTAIWTACPAAPSQMIWLCVVGSSRLVWVSGAIKGNEGGIIRIAFTEAFPYELFKEVVWGLPREEWIPALDNSTEIAHAIPTL